MNLLACFEKFLASAAVDISHDKLSLTQSLNFSLPLFLSRRMLWKWFLQQAHVHSMPSPADSVRHLGVESTSTSIPIWCPIVCRIVSASSKSVQVDIMWLRLNWALMVPYWSFIPLIAYLLVILWCPHHFWSLSPKNLKQPCWFTLPTFLYFFYILWDWHTIICCNLFQTFHVSL